MFQLATDVEQVVAHLMHGVHCNPAQWPLGGLGI